MYNIIYISTVHHIIYIHIYVQTYMHTYIYNTCILTSCTMYTYIHKYKHNPLDISETQAERHTHSLSARICQAAVHSTTLHPLPAKKKHFNYNTPTDIIYYLRTIITSHYPNLHISYIYLILTYISSCLYVILPVHYLIYMLSYLYVILPVRFLSFTISYLYVILPLHYLTCHFQFSEISR